MAMPQGMETFRAPILPEPEELKGHELALAALHAVLAALQSAAQMPTPTPTPTQSQAKHSVDVMNLPAKEKALINQVLGEGEVSAVVAADAQDARSWHIQESVFPGVWRVIASVGGQVVQDRIEVGAIPDVLVQTALADVKPALPAWQGPLPPNVQNAPSVLAELKDHWQTWISGAEVQVINLTLLPMSVEDIGFIDHHLGTGRITILSRGYGNCRITNSHMQHCWRVVYYNSQDAVILNTVEVGPLPSVAQAAAEDLQDSLERFAEVLAWVESP
jgi:hydrogenase-1 operon protein HyaF